MYWGAAVDKGRHFTVFYTAKATYIDMWFAWELWGWEGMAIWHPCTRWRVIHLQFATCLSLLMYARCLRSQIQLISTLLVTWWQYFQIRKGGSHKPGLSLSTTKNWSRPGRSGDVRLVMYLCLLSAHVPIAISTMRAQLKKLLLEDSTLDSTKVCHEVRSSL